MTPIIGIGTPLLLEDGEYIVFNITSKFENGKIQPLVLARKHKGVGGSSLIILTGEQIEAALVM